MVLLRRRYPNLKVGSGASVNSDCRFGDEISIGEGCRLDDTAVGDYTYINYNAIVKVSSIGKFCSIGPNVVIGLGNHPSRTYVSTSPRFYLAEHFADSDYHEQFAPVNIGNDVWIGANVTVVNGVSIGHGAIVGANAVVVDDVEPYSIVGGVPARHIRFRFEKDEIQFLLKDKWWAKDNQWIIANYLDFHSIGAYMAACGTSRGL